MPDRFSANLSAKSDRVLDEQTFNRLLRRTTTALGFGLGVPMLVLLGLVLYLLSSAEMVDHTDLVIAEAHHVDKLLVMMQTGFRGYRLANDEKYLQPFTDARHEIAGSLDHLDALIADRKDQSAAAAQLRSDVNVWLKFVDEQLADIRAGKMPAGDASFLTQGAPLFDAAEHRLTPFVDKEDQLREIREQRLNYLVLAVLAVFGMGVLIGIPLLTFWVRRLLRRVSDSYRLTTAAAERRAIELQVTFQSIGDAVIVTDASGHVEFLNAAAEKLMGWPTAEARNRPLTEVFPIFNEHTGAVVENPVERVLREKIIVGLANHTVLRTRDGREVPIEDSAAPIRGEDGTVLGVILVFHDVTEKRDRERALRASEILKGAILNTALDGFILMDHEGRIRDWNAAAERIFGVFRANVVGHRLADVMVPERLREAHRQGLARYLETREGQILGKRLELPALRIDGSEFPCELSIAVVPDIEPPMFAGYVRDITDRKKSETELLEAKAEAEGSARSMAEVAERFRLLVEVVSLQVWTAGINGELDYANQECVAYLDADLEHDILGNAWAQYVHPDDLPTALRSWQASLASGDRYETEFRLRGKDDVYRWFLVRAVAMRDEAGGIVRWLGTNTDVHALKVAQADAERASNAKDDFLAALSHELRTPLTPVLMTAASLHEDERLPAEVREQLGMIERNIGLEARLIDDLLDLTSIARGKLRLRSAACDAHSLIGLAIEIVRDDAQTKGLSLNCDFTARLSGLVADPARFQQVIWNLLRNAVKFTPRGGSITIRTQDEVDPQEGAWLRIEISDSGIGIEPALLKQIFLPFEQGAQDGDHRFGGIGLGLAIARAIVDLHGGRISARSVGINQGATFIVEFPGASLPPHGVAAASGGSASAPGTSVESAAPAEARVSLRLLLVEDHEPTLQVLTLLLKRDDHTVTTASTMEDALAAAHAVDGAFDLVISDLGLPDGTGNDLMERLRDTYKLRGIALTGYGMEEDLARSREAGFVAHLVKPVHFSDLRRTLAHWGKTGTGGG